MPKRVNKDEKREKIVQAAIPIFAKRGFRETKMADIAISADVGKGTLYEYFDSKDELFVHSFKLWFSYFAEQMQEISSKEKNPYQRLILFYQQFFDTVEKYGDVYLIYFDFWSELTRNPELNPVEIVAVYQSLRDTVSEVLEDGVKHANFRLIDCQQVSMGLVAIADGLLMQWLFDKSCFSIKEVGVKIVESYLQSFING